MLLVRDLYSSLFFRSIHRLGKESTPEYTKNKVSICDPFTYVILLI